MTTRRFPPPWSVEDIGAAFVVKDSAGQKLAYDTLQVCWHTKTTLRPEKARLHGPDTSVLS
jgi:hypothetical protein